MIRKKLPYEIEFKGEELITEKFYVLSFIGEELLNEGYSFNIKIISNKQIELKKFLETKNKNVTFIMNVNEKSRYIHGFCTSASIENMVNGLFIYEIKISSPLCLLEVGKKSKVFLDLTIEDVISSILKEKHFTNGLDYEFLLNPKSYDPSKENYEEIDYLCQYNESNLEFIKRWLAEFGFRLHFIQDQNVSKMIISDYNGAFEALDNEILEFSPSLNYKTDSFEAISSLKIVQNRVALKSLYLNNDLRYEHTNLEVDGKIDDLEEAQEAEQTYFGGTPFLQINSNRYQAIEDERIKSQSQNIILDTNNHLMSVGFTFKVKNHFFLKQNYPLLILKVKHSGNQLSFLKNLENEIGKSLLGYNLSKDFNLYENKVEAIDSNIEYRTARVKNKRRISGIVLAKIKAEDGGDQAYRGKECAYKVKMPFDTISSKNNTSSWIHTIGDSQGRGIQVTLKDGDDVAIGFMEGDVNRPYIVGAINQRGSIIEDGIEAKIETGNYSMVVGKSAAEIFNNKKGNK